MEVRSEITGNVWQVHVEAGAEVAAGDVLLILESMKMEITVDAPIDGTVIEVRVEPEDPVTEGAVLIVLAER